MRTSNRSNAMPAARPLHRSRLHRVLWAYWTYGSIRLVLGALFFYAGLTKLIDPEGLVVIIDAYGLIPDLWVRPVATLLPVLETAAGLGLILDARYGLTATAVLLLLFMAILGYGMWLGLDIDCGCFGPTDPEAAAFSGLRGAFYRDAVMILGIIYLYTWRLKRAFAPTWPVIRLRTRLTNGGI